ncbi:MAG TPA: hypothetical protein PKA05_18695 [Roseiflexaceae bacterium]|nr:hypothetical protein [Roseiflexaceae bacterium]HMP42414.1 hypothetical protein [Roseiflexaceae bacterium]
MSSSASTPEELETLFEDAILLRDPGALAALFDDGAVLATGRQAPARDGATIAQHALVHWHDEHVFIANPQCVVQARDIALIVAARSIHVAQRDNDGIWRYRIVLLADDAIDPV